MEKKFRYATSDVNFWADSTLSKKNLGWESTTSLEEGIKQTWKWLQTQ